MASPSSSTLTLKLLINTQVKKVLFAEAGKDFVDFIFALLSLPVGTVVRLLEKQEMVGSLAKLYGSLENLNDSYIHQNQSKQALLKPATPVSGVDPLLALGDAPATTKKEYYRCGGQHCGTYVADDSNADCPNCRKKMTTIMQYVPSPTAQLGLHEGGIVKGVVTYMVMDDLVVTPMSTITSITLLNKFNVKDVGVLEEKVVHFGVDEAVKLLKASMQSKKVLTEVFLNGLVCNN